MSLLGLNGDSEARRRSHHPRTLSDTFGVEQNIRTVTPLLMTCDEAQGPSERVRRPGKKPRAFAGNTDAIDVAWQQHSVEDSLD